jgi:hypothetical protein
MGKTRLPRDDNNHAIPVLRFRTGGAQQLSISADSAVRASVPLGTRVISVTCSVNAHFETGDENVTATSSSHYIPAGFPFDMALGSDLSDIDGYHSYISVISHSDAGTVYISERE